MCTKQPQPRDRQTTQTLRLASIPPALFTVLLLSSLTGWQIVHRCSPLVTLQIYSALIKWAVCYWSVPSSLESVEVTHLHKPQPPHVCTLVYLWLWWTNTVKKHLKLSVLFVQNVPLIFIQVDGCFQTDTAERLCIHKFTLLSSIALLLFCIVTTSGFSFHFLKYCSISACHLGKMYFWDQDPVLVLLQMYSTRLNGPWSANETKQVCVFIAAFKGFVY